MVVSIGYLLVIAIAGRFGKLPVYPLQAAKKRIAIIIPSYKEDAVIIDTARNAIAHNYPSENFRVLIVADKLEKETLSHLRQLPVSVLEADVNMNHDRYVQACNF